ncbi:uncharacterized protein [Procambarus clarkii]|uniref:uncharacterized protein isoform X1 n=2 Tax=Procambarus clarkii TaxID=6728 RepID=UPI0037445828
MIYCLSVTGRASSCVDASPLVLTLEVCGKWLVRMSFTELEYVSLAPDDLDDISHLLVNHFYLRDIMTLVLGVSPESKLAIDLNHIRTCLATGLSLGARDKSTKQLVGVLLNSILAFDATVIHTPSKSNETEMMHTHFLRLLGQVADLTKHHGVTNILLSTRGCIHPDYEHRGLFTKLVQMSVNIGIKEGCTLASAAAINPHSEKAFLRVGYKVGKTLDFNTVEEVLLDLSHVSHTVLKVMTKVLSPITTSS